MSGRVNIPCRNPTQNFKFVLNDGRNIVCRATTEEGAANKIPTLFGKDVKWAQGIISGKVYKF